jgi:hypothetical protein
MSGSTQPSTRTRLNLEVIEDRAVPATVGGYAWYDANANGTFDEGEGPAEGAGWSSPRFPAARR